MCSPRRGHQPSSVLASQPSTELSQEGLTLCPHVCEARKTHYKITWRAKPLSAARGLTGTSRGSGSSSFTGSEAVRVRTRSVLRGGQLCKWNYSSVGEERKLWTIRLPGVTPRPSVLPAVSTPLSPLPPVQVITEQLPQGEFPGQTGADCGGGVQWGERAQEPAPGWF